MLRQKTFKGIKNMNTNTVIIYKGKSPKNNQPITAILSGLDTPSKNPKTGNMAQIDILLEDIHPWEAIKTGQDAAICGDCPMRPSQKNINDENVDCYVNTMHGPASKYKAMKRGAYLQLEPLAVGQILKARNLSVRFGSYGDPAMLPFEVIDTIIKTAGTSYTSYTHQYMMPWFDSRHLIYSMASVDHINTVEKLQAIHPNARYYKIADDYNNLASNEIACPSDKNKTDIFGNRLVTCSNCGLCSGTKKQAKNIVIIDEGNTAKTKTKKSNWIEEFVAIK